MKPMLSKTFSLAVILSILLSACSLPGAGGTAPVTGPGGGTGTAESIFEEGAVDLPPADFVAVYEEKVASGEWTEGQGLVTLLQVFAGELAVDQAGVDASSLIENEGTGILSLAIEYLENGSDDAVKAEITRLVDLLVPAHENLLLYSQEDSGRFPTQKGAVPPALQAPDCAALWAGGFPDTRTPSFPCFLANTQNIGGSTYQVFFPAAWAGDESKRLYYDLTRQAIADAVPVMQGYGQMRPIYFVFSVLGDPDDPLSTLAVAHVDRYRRNAEACPVVIYPMALSLADSGYKQTIAHEIVHCFMGFNLPGQTLGAGYDSSKWWEESTAEYFSNLVYPAAEYEYRWIDDFNRGSFSRSLIGMKYENFLFFQFLGNQLGPEGVLQVLRAMPTTPGKDKQLAALAAYPNMATLYEEFVRQFLDNRIRDTSGRIHPYSVFYPNVININAPMSGNLEFKDFMILRWRLSFAQAKKYLYAFTSTPPEMRMQGRLELAPGLWQPFPLAVDAGCVNHEYIVYFTGFGGSENTRTASAGITAESSVCTAGCLVGTWEMDNEVYKLYLRSFMNSSGAGDPILQWVEGQALLTFDEAGNTAAEYRDLTVQMFLHTVENILDEEVTPEMRISMNGGSTASYTSTETTITTARSTTNLQFTVNLYVGGFPMDVPVNIPFDQNTFSGGPVSGATEYLCQEGILIIETAAPGNPALLYHRLSP